jgi:hypothetical protein
VVELAGRFGIGRDCVEQLDVSAQAPDPLEQRATRLVVPDHLGEPRPVFGIELGTGEMVE